MTKDDLIREYNQRAASWPALLGVYLILVAVMAVSAMSII
jgi:hypothetical protein